MKTRNIIFTILTVVIVNSCSEKEVPAVIPEETNKIEFSRVETKGVSSIRDIERFGVWTVLADAESSTPEYMSILTNEEVVREGLSAPYTWNYDDTQYWIDDCHFYFLASFPYSQDGNGVDSFQESEITEDGIKRTYYSLLVDTFDEDGNKNAGHDILTAVSYVNTSDDYDNVVNLTFTHLFTKVNIKITQNIDPNTGDPLNDYYIKKVSLQGVYPNGYYFLIPDGNQIRSEWVIDTQQGKSFEKSFEPTKSLKEHKELSVWGDEAEGGLLLIPQAINEFKVKIRIEYDYLLTTDDAQDSILIKDRYIEEYLPASTDLWQSNKQITYMLSISEPSSIRFYPPKITPWDSPVTCSSIIIK